MVNGEKFAVDPEQINVKFEDVKGVGRSLSLSEFFVGKM